MKAPEKPSISTFTELNVRQETGKPHFIRLHDSVVQRLERILTDNPVSTGLLLGSIEENENCTIAVEQFEPTTKIEELIRARKSAGSRKVVGYYRAFSKDSFTLEASDRALFQRCFPKESRLALLVKPPKENIGTAMFFLGENGTLVTGRATVEFPFNLRELGAEEAPTASAPAAATASTKSAVSLPAGSPARGRLLWKIAVAGVVVIASVFGLSELRVFDRTSEQPRPIDAALKPSVAEPPVPEPAVKTITQPAMPAKQTTTASDGVKPGGLTSPAKPKAVVVNPRTARMQTTARPYGPDPPQPTPPPPLPRSEPVASTEPAALPPPVAPPVNPKPVVASLPYTAPSAIRQFAPVVPENVRRAIAGEVAVHVRVNVDAAGKVIAATPVETGSPVAEALAEAAISSIKKWQFEPARRGSDKVPGEIVLGFIFRK